MRKLVLGVIAMGMLVGCRSTTDAANFAGDGGLRVQGGDGGASCRGLSESSCRAAASRGCQTAACGTFDGSSGFVGCLEPGEPLPGCPGSAACTCRVPTDCKKLDEVCVAPGGSAGCGAAFVPDVVCTGDAECADRPGYICDVAPCTLGSDKSCTAGCGFTGCPIGFVCGSDLRCAPQTCGPAAACPEQFDCGGGICARRACSGDTECDASGWCVHGACYAGPGICEPLAA